MNSRNYTVVFVISLILTIFLFVLPFLAMKECCKSLLEIVYQNLTHLLVAFTIAVVIIGGLPLLRLAINGVMKKSFPLELSVLLGVILLFGYGVYTLIYRVEDALLYFKPAAAIITISLLYEIIVIKVFKPGPISLELFPDDESPAERKVRIVSIIMGTMTILIAMGYSAFLFLWHGITLDDVILRAATILVIAGPCNLHITSRLAVQSAVDLLGNHGIKLRETSLFRKIYDAYVFMFSKTGIITQGKYIVKNIAFETYKKVKRTELLKLAGSLERKAEHPIAGAILNQLNPPSEGWAEVHDFSVREGMGIEGKIDERMVRAGRRELFSHIDYSLQYKSQEEERNGNTVIYIGYGDEVSGAIYLADQIRSKMRSMAIGLHEARKQVCLLSNDSFLTVKAIAEKCRIKNFVAEATNAEKVIEIRNHQRKARGVAVVADPQRDEELLRQADVAIALENDELACPDFVMVTIKADCLHELPLLARVSKKVLGVIHFSVLWLMLYNIGIVAATIIGGLFQPISGAAIMICSSLIVTIDSFRISKIPRNPL